MCNSGRADRVPAAMLPVQLLPESPSLTARIGYSMTSFLTSGIGQRWKTAFVFPMLSDRWTVFKSEKNRSMGNLLNSEDYHF